MIGNQVDNYRNVVIKTTKTRILLRIIHKVLIYHLRISDNTIKSNLLTTALQHASTQTAGLLQKTQKTKRNNIKSMHQI